MPLTLYELFFKVSKIISYKCKKINNILPHINSYILLKLKLPIIKLRHLIT